MKIVIVGQAPGPRSGSAPFDGLSGDRLGRYMGFSGREELRATAECHNLLTRYPGPRGSKGDRFPRWKARTAARELSTSLRERRVLLAGRLVAEAFGVRAEYFKWVRHAASFDAVVIPHPSGVNHWWNDPLNRERFTCFAHDTLRGLR